MLYQIYTFLLLAALLPFAIRSTRAKSIVSAVVITLGGVYAIAGAAELLLTGSDTLIPDIDTMGAIFLVTVAINGIACAIYSIGYTAHCCSDKSHTQTAIHFASMVTLFFAMLNIITATDPYRFLLWWELMTLATFLLLLFDARRKEILHAAMGFVVLMHVGFFVLLGAFAASGAAILGGGAISIGVWVMFIVGFGLKSAIVPLHIWLPVTYHAAPSHISAMLSGVSINLGIYGVVRATLALDPSSLQSAGLALFAIGALSALFGASRATAQNDLKRLLAYSSIDNVGIIMMGLGIGTIGRAAGSEAAMAIGYGAALLHTMGHANYKILLFMSAGAIESATKTTDLNRMGGLLRRMPLTGGLMLLGVLAICSVPPLMGFASEFVLMGGMFRSIAAGEMVVVSIVGIIVLALVGGLSVMAFGKAFGVAMLGTPRSCEARESKEVSLWMLLPAALPAAGIIIGPILYSYMVLSNSASLFGSALEGSILDKSTWDGSALVATLTHIEIIGCGLIALTIALVGLKWALNRAYRVPVTVKPIWGCGFTSPNKRMQYSAGSVNRDLQNVLATHRGENETKEFDENELFPTRTELHPPKRRGQRHTITHYFSHLMHRWSARLALFQTGKTNHYILHALLLLIIILILSLMGIL